MPLSEGEGLGQRQKRIPLLQDCSPEFIEGG